MESIHQFNDTICAVATPHGVGAQSTVKLSGREAISIASAIFRPANKSLTIDDVAPYTACYGWFYDPNDGSLIDDGIVLIMKAPHSYTGEDQVELTYHGNPYISQLLLDALIQKGARMAEPGEYTRRAFANGKMDLSQAEAVADVIAASNRSALRLSLTQMKGGFRSKINQLREQLIHLASLVELELDFSEEDIELVPRDQLLEDCRTINAEVSALAESYATGQVIKNGIPIAIAGATNAGKSTLLNGLLNDDKAIVSDIHGTTRDTIEDTLLISGQLFRIIDTAGIRSTDDKIESIGIEKALRKVASADLVMWVIDATDTEDRLLDIFELLTKHTDAKKILAVVNKVDLTSEAEIEKILKWLGEHEISMNIVITAKDDASIDSVKSFLHHHFSKLIIGDDQLMVTNMRQATALRQASKSLSAVAAGIQSGLSGDFIAQDLRVATTHLGTVVGEVTTDDLLSSIFANFCIGK